MTKAVPVQLSLKNVVKKIDIYVLTFPIYLNFILGNDGLIYSRMESYLSLCVFQIKIYYLFETVCRSLHCIGFQHQQ